MASTLNEIDHACVRLRQAHESVLLPMSQAQIVALIADWADRWKDPQDHWRRAAEALSEPFPFAMTRISLEALLQSLTEKALWELIDAEQVRNVRSVPLIGHVIAGNTPLLAWTSLLRALLMRSASFVKLPSGGAGNWGRLFVELLTDVSPELASCVHLDQWQGGTRELDAALCQNVDLILAYGSQSTIEMIRSLCPASVGILCYGHRVSFGLMLSGASSTDAAQGFARDILLYDQGGCLSPHTIFVEGDLSESAHFAEHLAASLSETVPDYPVPSRSPQAAARVQEARALARMEFSTILWEDQDLRWTVIAREERVFAVSPTHGVISVQPITSPDDLPQAMASVTSHLQGCAITREGRTDDGNRWRDKVGGLGVSWICLPGQMQAPPFSWREDGQDVLRSLLPSLAAGGNTER